MNKNKVLAILGAIGVDTYTPIRTLDKNCANESFCKMPVEGFFDDEAVEYLMSEEWMYIGVEPADPDKIDMDVWAQDFEMHEVQALKESLLNKQIKIASFRHEIYGTMDIMIWE